MKIVFVGLCAAFSEGMSYQDNLLAEVAAHNKHEVVFISNPERYIDGKMTDVEPCDIMLENGIHLIRLPYVKFGSQMIYKKIRIFKNVYSTLEEIAPDIIFCHNHHYMAVLDVVKYKKIHPHVQIFADNHANEYNSASNWLSLNVLHKVYYRYLIKKLIPYLNRYFYIGEPEAIFAKKTYKIPEEIMEYMPLGGIRFNDLEYYEKRRKKRAELHISDDELLLVHSGKMDSQKKTKDLIEAFGRNKGLNAKLIIIGTIVSDVHDELVRLIASDNRIQYIGWKKADELLEYLCACDIYCQPGSPSATLQNAICCRSAILTYPHLDYVKNMKYDCFFWCECVDDIVNVFSELSLNPTIIDAKKRESIRCATELLDYEILLNKFVKRNNDV